MENENQKNLELDDDILQCRADILQNLSRNDDAEPTFNRNNAAARRVRPSAGKSGGPEISKKPETKNDIRIPQFEDLVASENQVVDGIWESPEVSELKPEPEMDVKDQAVAKKENSDEVLPLDREIVVTEEEEMALFDGCEPEAIAENSDEENGSEDGLEALRKIVAEAENNLQPITEETTNTDEVTAGGDIEQITDEAASETEGIEIELAATEAVEEPTQPEVTEEPVTSLPEDDLTAGVETGSSIPNFNLAEKILTEQRQTVSRRRQRPERARNLNVLPIAGTVGKIIERARQAAAKTAEKSEAVKIVEIPETLKETVSQAPAKPNVVETVEFNEEPVEPVLSAAACRVINDSDRLNPFQENIIVEIVSRDIARFCGELNANC